MVSDVHPELYYGYEIDGLIPQKPNTEHIHSMTGGVPNWGSNTGIPIRYKEGDEYKVIIM